jgi:pyrroloquinoline quinone biosynthesis protein B
VRVLVLGSAAGGGYPQWNCNCTVCRRTRTGDPAAPPRTQSSVAVSADGDDWFLLNAAPDLRQQINENPPLQPRHGRRHSPIAGVVLTNGDVDHVAGLLTLRERQPLVVYATAAVHATLRANSIFGVLAADLVQRRTFGPGTAVPLERPDGSPSGLAIEAFTVPGKVALYLEGADAGIDADLVTTSEDTVGLKVSALDGSATFFYIPGCAAMTPELRARLDGAGLVLFDGTLWQDDEMIASHVGVKTGRRMAHMSLSGEDGSIAAFRDQNIGRKVYIHINNTNPILVADTPERAAVEAAGWEVAYDGMTIEL